MLLQVTVVEVWLVGVGLAAGVEAPHVRVAFRKIRNDRGMIPVVLYPRCKEDVKGYKLPTEFVLGLYNLSVSW